MAWNEESDNKKDKDPWGKNGNQGPPDLDEIVKKMQKGIGGIFGNKPTKKGDTPVFPFFPQGSLSFLLSDSSFQAIKLYLLGNSHVLEKNNTPFQKPSIPS